MTSTPSSQTSELRQWLAQAKAALLFKVALFFLGTVVAIFLLAWLIFSEGSDSIFVAEQGEAVFAVEAIDALAQPGLVELEVDGVNMGVVQSLDPPQMIELNGFQLTVSTRYLGENELWQGVTLPANQVGWLENSIVNYVFRLPSGRGYRDILEQLGGDSGSIRLTTAQGNQLLFTPSERGERPFSASGTRFAQDKPSITLLWLGDGEDKTTFFVSGNYAAAAQERQVAGQASQQLEADIANSVIADPLTVHLETATIQADGLQLAVQGTITNRGVEAQTLTAQDIQLSANGLVSQMIAVEPPLPWQIPAHNSQMIFKIILQRPLESNGLLSIGSHSFQLSVDEK